MQIKFVATCLKSTQKQICQSYGIDVIKDYATSYGEIMTGCITDFSIHCFNSASLSVLHSLGVKRATLHPELNLAQIRDIIKPIDTEIIIYGRIPLMKLGNPQLKGYITDRKGMKFFIDRDILYNTVPLLLADKLDEIAKTNCTHSRLIFTDETPDDTHKIIKAYLQKKMIKIDFTRGKFFSKV